MVLMYDPQSQLIRLCERSISDNWTVAGGEDDHWFRGARSVVSESTTSYRLTDIKRPTIETAMKFATTQYKSLSKSENPHVSRWAMIPPRMDPDRILRTGRTRLARSVVVLMFPDPTSRVRLKMGRVGAAHLVALHAFVGTWLLSRSAFSNGLLHHGN